MAEAPVPPRVLVVEDDDGIAAALEFVLRRDGLDYDRAREGSRGLEKARARKPDLVLLDIMLPGISGYEVCDRLRADPAMKGVRILMMTARGSAAEQRRAMEHGADGFIAKPFDLAALRAEVARLTAPRG